MTRDVGFGDSFPLGATAAGEGVNFSLYSKNASLVELLPIFQFDPQDCPPGRTNSWGYCPVSFFAPHPAYSSRQGPLEAIDEFRVESDRAKYSNYTGTVQGPRLDAVIYLMINAYWESLDFELPPVPAQCKGPWRRWIDTSRDPPEDICEWQCGAPVMAAHYAVSPRSLGTLVAWGTCVGRAAAE